MVYQNIENKRKRQHSWNKATFSWKRKRKSHDNLRSAHGYAAFVKSCKEANEKCEQYWNSIIPILKNMQNQLLELGKPPKYTQVKENIEYCVKLFAIVSEAQDALEGYIKIYPYNKLDAVKAFNNDLFYGGRHSIDERRNDTYQGKVPYWNTTNVGEKITMDNIQFGPDIGLPQHPASYWIKLSKKKRVYMEEQTTYTKGKISKTVIVWATEAIVKINVNGFIRVAYEAFTKELDEMLKNE